MSAQFVTLDQAKEFATLVDAKGIGGGVMPLVSSTPEGEKPDYHNGLSGIYLPPWGSTGPENAEPHEGDAWQYLLRFNQQKQDGTHVEGFNVGLSLDIAARHSKTEGGPPNLDYALDSLEKEVAAQLAESNQG